MRTFLCAWLVSLLTVVTAVPGRAAAQEAEELRRELEQMRKQFEQVQQDYQKALATMAERLQRLEARPATATTAPAVVQAPPAPTPAPSSAPPPPTLRDYVQPRQPFSLYERTGRGQLLFDMGIAADFIGNLTQKKVDEANAGTFAGRENRFFPREIELSFFGQIDPYARGEVRIEAAEEFEDGERDLHVSLAEAHLTLLTLPWGLQAKMGKMRNRWGLLNQVHQHDLPQPDRPNVLVNFFGEEQLVESGVEVTWVPALPFYLELLGGIFNGDNDVAFGQGSLRHPLLTGRVRTFLELGRFGALQLGTSVASGETSDDRNNDSTIWGLDAKYKYTPEGWRHPLLTLGGEYLWSNRQTTVTGEVEVDTDGDGVADATEETSEARRLKHSGWYLYAEVQPWKQWLAGLRYDWSQYPVNPGNEWAIEPYIAFMPSEFLRFRLGYKHTERSKGQFFEANGGSGRVADEIFLQATFILGAHPAHPF
jgi:hypothetical protein